LFEAIALAIHLDTDRMLLPSSVNALSKFLNARVRSWRGYKALN
jgi:hypothetical protein